jgi:hypothetical protein
VSDKGLKTGQTLLADKRRRKIGGGRRAAEYSCYPWGWQEKFIRKILMPGVM